jgi:hypothetical protein
MLEPAGITNGVATVSPILNVGSVPAAFGAEIGAKNCCCVQTTAPVFDGAITPLFVGLLRLLMRRGDVKVLDIIFS